MKRGIIFCIVTMLFLVSCSPKNSIDSYGLYYKAGNKYKLISKSDIYPFSATDNDPEISVKNDLFLKYPVTSIENVYLKNTDIDEAIDINISKSGDDLYKIIPIDSMLEGSYCIVIGDQWSSLKNLTRWCFNFSSNSNSEIDSHTSSSFPNWLTGTWKYTVNGEEPSNLLIHFDASGNVWFDDAVKCNYQLISESTIKFSEDCTKSGVWLVEQRSKNQLSILESDTKLTLERLKLANVDSSEDLSGLFTLDLIIDTKNIVHFIYGYSLDNIRYRQIYTAGSDYSEEIDEYQIISPGLISVPNCCLLAILNYDSETTALFSGRPDRENNIYQRIPVNESLQKDIIGIWEFVSNETYVEDDISGEALVANSEDPILGKRIEFTKTGDFVYHDAGEIDTFSFPHPSIFEVGDPKEGGGNLFFVIESSKNKLVFLHSNDIYTYEKFR